MKHARSALGVIPARARSSRFPNKPLAEILDKPMIQHVWEAARRCTRLAEVVVATDSEEIANRVRAFGGEAVMTSEAFESGTDRVAWVAKQKGLPLVVNIQGDEPLISPASIDALVEALEKQPDVAWATLAVRSDDEEELGNPNVVKVVVGESNRALYFSRQPLVSGVPRQFLKHIGIYGYRLEALEKFCRLPQSKLEKAERLEQLRALEHGMNIHVEVIERDTIAVDTPEDIARVERYLLERTSS